MQRGGWVGAPPPFCALRVCDPRVLCPRANTPQLVAGKMERQLAEAEVQAETATHLAGRVRPALIAWWGKGLGAG